MERSDWKLARRDLMVAAALDVFIEKGIDASTLDEVALRAKVGIASVYRHFGTKADLAVAAAERLWQSEWAAFGSRPEDQNKESVSGWLRVQSLLGRFLVAFDEHRQIFGFLEDFDRYVVREGLDPSRLDSYDRMLLSFRQVLKDALAQGQRDGSVRQDLDGDLFCATVSQAFVALAEKLVSRPLVVPSDKDLAGRRELELLVDWAMEWLRPKS